MEINIPLHPPSKGDLGGCPPSKIFWYLASYILQHLVWRPFYVYIYVYEEVYMRTNIVIDDALLNSALKLSRAKSKKEVIHWALQEFVENKKRLNLLDLEGKIKFSDDYNYKKLRK